METAGQMQNLHQLLKTVPYSFQCTEILAFERIHDYDAFKHRVIALIAAHLNQSTMKMWLKNTGL